MSAEYRPLTDEEMNRVTYGLFYPSHWFSVSSLPCLCRDEDAEGTEEDTIDFFNEKFACGRCGRSYRLRLEVSG